MQAGVSTSTEAGLWALDHIWTLGSRPHRGLALDTRLSSVSWPSLTNSGQAPSKLGVMSNTRFDRAGPGSTIAGLWLRPMWGGIDQYWTEAGQAWASSTEYGLGPGLTWSSPSIPPSESELDIWRQHCTMMLLANWITQWHGRHRIRQKRTNGTEQPNPLRLCECPWRESDRIKTWPPNDSARAGRTNYACAINTPTHQGAAATTAARCACRRADITHSGQRSPAYVRPARRHCAQLQSASKRASEARNAFSASGLRMSPPLQHGRRQRWQHGGCQTPAPSHTARTTAWTRPQHAAMPRDATQACDRRAPRHSERTHKPTQAPCLRATADTRSTLGKRRGVSSNRRRWDHDFSMTCFSQRAAVRLSPTLISSRQCG